MQTSRWILLSDAVELIASATDKPKAELLSAMRRGELPWRAFFEKFPPPSPELVPTKFRTAAVIPTVARMRARQFKQIIEASSADGYNSVLAKVSPDSVDWENSELIVPDQMRPRLHDICVERAGLERLWGASAEVADPRAHAAKKREKRNKRLRELAGQLRESDGGLSDHRIAEVLAMREEFEIGAEAIRKIIGRRRQETG